MDGIIVVNKPLGITSHDVVDKVRKKFKMKKVGHAGTLDPLASGVLVLLLGKATKLSLKFMDFNKAYKMTMQLGVVTDTGDREGKVLRESSYEGVTEDILMKEASKFIGDIKQMVPMYSAVKVNGKKLYEYARKGIVVERPVRDISIHKLLLESFSVPYADMYLECSKGTYVRQLAEDIGENLGCGAYVTKIERTKVGSFTIDESIKLEDLNEGHVRDWTG